MIDTIINVEVVYTNIFPGPLPSEGLDTWTFLLPKSLFINNILHEEKSGLPEERADSRTEAGTVQKESGTFYDSWM